MEEGKALQRLRLLTWWRLGVPFLLPALYLAFFAMMNRAFTLLLVTTAYTILLLASARIVRHLAAHGQVRKAILALLAAYVAMALLLILPFQYVVEQCLTGTPYWETAPYILTALVLSFVPGLLFLLVLYLPLILKLR